MPATAAPRRDFYADITKQLIAAIEANPAAPTLPWRTDGQSLALPTNAVTGKVYSGVNVIALWVAAARTCFVEPVWATYQQWTKLGAQVRKGERGSTIIFYKEVEKAAGPEEAEEAGIRRIARASAVFNVAQVDGLTVRAAAPPPSSSPVERLAAIDQFISNTKAEIRYGGQQAFYHRQHDFIQLPATDRFIGSATMPPTEAFYATALHELIHWTGAGHRLNRVFGERFGDHAYAAEELVAEIGAAFLCSEFGITQAVRPDHAQYLNHWLQLLKNDSRAIFAAASKAAAAAAFIKQAAQCPPDNPSYLL